MVKTLRKVPNKAGKEELQRLRENLNPPAPPPVATPPSPEETKSTSEPVPIDQQRQTIGYFLTPSGDIDIERMNTPNIEKLRKLFAAPGVQKNILKIEEPPAPPKEPALPPVMIEKMYDALSMLEVAAATRVFKVDAEIAERVIPFTPKEKALLVPATTIVVDKYSGDWLKKYKDEVFLGTMLLTIFSAKIVQLRLQLAILEQQRKSGRVAQPSASAEVVVPPGEKAAVSDPQTGAAA